MQDREEIFEVPPEGLNVGELADLLAVNAAEVVKALFMKGVMAQVNQQLDLDTVRLAAAAFGADAVEAGAAVRLSHPPHLTPIIVKGKYSSSVLWASRVGAAVPLPANHPQQCNSIDETVFVCRILWLQERRMSS